MDTTTRNGLSDVLIALLRGVVYSDSSPQLWRDLLNLQSSSRDHLRLLGLDLIIDEAEGYAYLRQSEADDEDNSDAPRRLIARRPLSYPVNGTRRCTQDSPRCLR
jgi:hypothetical protein